VAISTIAMFTVVNQSLAGYITILRIAILLLCTVFGMFGFMVSVVALVAYLSTLQSMGFSYLSTISPPSFRDLMNRINPTSYKVSRFRPDFLKTKDKTRRRG
ncbi:MAG: gerXA, partial [Paenibacillus sp.]|nr:gerXA [Paenibacillus sp.]